MTVLVLRALGLGDFFTGLPALAMLRSAVPGERIVLAVPDAYRELALSSGYVDVTIHGHELSPLRTAPARPRLAVDLHGNGPASRELLQATRPRRLVAFDDASVPWDPREHEVRRWCRLIREGLPAPDVAEPSVVHCLPVPPDNGMALGRTIVHCGAKSVARRWPAERFTRVAAALRGAGHDVVITGGPDERGLLEDIAARARVDACGHLNLRQLVGLISGARLLISGDTGVAHVATNYRTPSVVLFGPVSPRVWGPPDDPRHQVLWHGDGNGDAHGQQTDPALLHITEDEVLIAAELATASVAL